MANSPCRKPVGFNKQQANGYSQPPADQVDMLAVSISASVGFFLDNSAVSHDVSRH